MSHLLNRFERKLINFFISWSFPACLGFIDGTHFILSTKPCKNGEDYYNRKQAYSISAMVVCDHEKRIRNLFLGLPGCAHDARVFRLSDLGQQLESYFEGDEYLLADSGYANTERVIANYKRPLANLPDNQRYNYYHSAARIRVEHCIGILKGRFPSLRGLPIRIRNKRDHARAVMWCNACCVLHNLLLNMNDGFEDSWLVLDGEEDGHEEDAVDFNAQDCDGDGRVKRERVKEYVLRHLH